jgi:hypothetical protein
MPETHGIDNVGSFRRSDVTAPAGQFAGLGYLRAQRLSLILKTVIMGPTVQTGKA